MRKIFSLAVKKTKVRPRQLQGEGNPVVFDLTVKTDQGEAVLTFDAKQLKVLMTETHTAAEAAGLADHTIGDRFAIWMGMN